MISLTCLSIILVITGRIDIGLYPAGNFLFVPLGIETTLANFHSLGNLPVEVDKLMSLDSNGAVQFLRFNLRYKVSRFCMAFLMVP